jgi:hypothetical protein
MSSVNKTSDLQQEPGLQLVNETIMEPLDSADMESLGLASSMLTNPEHVYTFQLKGYSTLVSTAGGTISAFLPFDPSSTGFNFSEWSSLAALFTEFRLVEYSAQFVAAFNTGIGQMPLAIGSNISYSSAPTSYGQVINQADSKIWAGQHDTSRLGYTHVCAVNDLGWSLTSSVTATPYAGAPGCIQIYSDMQGATVNIGRVLCVGIYEFRSRN